MKTSIRLALAGCALAGLVTGAGAQPQDNGRGGPVSPVFATFYARPDFNGAPITITRDTPDMRSVNFDDTARSARVVGPWQVCDEPNFRGRCAVIEGVVENLDSVGLAGRISSARPGAHGSGPGSPERPPGLGGPGAPGGGWGGRPEAQQRFEGRQTVFFPNPTVRGQPVMAFRGAADMFCRRQGLGDAVYFDGASRGRGMDQQGRFQPNVTILTDVLCRRR